jgi:hypothetical protein
MSGELFLLVYFFGGILTMLDFLWDMMLAVALITFAVNLIMGVL